MTEPVAGPSITQIATERSAALGAVLSRHRAALFSGMGTVGTGLLGVVLGGGLVVLEVMGELDKPLAGIPIGLGFFGFGCFCFWRLREDLKMYVEVRERGLVFFRARDERTIPWGDVVNVSWLQSGSTGKVLIAELFLDLPEGSRVKLPLERLTDPRTITAAISEKLRVQFPHH